VSLLVMDVNVAAKLMNRYRSFSRSWSVTGRPWGTACRAPTTLTSAKCVAFIEIARDIAWIRKENPTRNCRSRKIALRRCGLERLHFVDAARAVAIALDGSGVDSLADQRFNVDPAFGLL